MVPASAKKNWLLWKNVYHVIVVISVVSSINFTSTFFCVMRKSQHSRLNLLLVANEIKVSNKNQRVSNFSREYRNGDVGLEFLLLTFKIFYTFSSVSVVVFEQINVNGRLSTTWIMREYVFSLTRISRVLPYSLYYSFIVEVKFSLE